MGVPWATQNRTTLWRSVPLLGVYLEKTVIPEDTHPSVHSSTKRSQDMEPAKTSTNSWMDKKDGVHIHSTILQSLSRVRLFATPWITACQASLSITNSWCSLRLTSIESVMPSSHFILCHPLLLPPSIFPSNKVFSHESAFSIRWPKDWSFTFNISPSSEYSGLISFRNTTRP